MAERALAFYLLEMQRQGTYGPGYKSAAHWAERNLDLKRADKLILLAKRLEKLPEIQKAFNSGEVGWTKIREIARVATEKTERKWLERARQLTSRELEKEVRGHNEGDPPEGGLKSRRRKYLQQFRVSGEGKAYLDKAVRKIMTELGPRATPGQAAVEMAKIALSTDPEGNVPGRKRRTGELSLDFSAHRVVHLENPMPNLGFNANLDFGWPASAYRPWRLFWS